MDISNKECSYSSALRSQSLAISSKALTQFGLHVSGKACFHVPAFFPSVLCSRWSVTLASAHTEQTICLLLFSACQKQTHHFS